MEMSFLTQHPKYRIIIEELEKYVNNQLIENLEPVSIEKLLAKYSDYTIAELVLKIKEVEEALEKEKKRHAADEFARAKAETKCVDLSIKIQNAELALSGKEETE